MASALEKIQQIQAKADQEIKQLKEQAVSEVVRRLSEAKQLVKDLEAQYTGLTGKNLKGETVGSKKPAIVREVFTDPEGLTVALQKAPEKKLNRKGFSDAGYSLKSALAIAKKNPKTFGFEQNGPQGSVWLK